MTRRHVSLKCVVPLSRSLCIRIAKISRCSTSNTFEIVSWAIKFTAREIFVKITPNYGSKLNFEADLKGFARRGFAFQTKPDSPNPVFIPDFRTKIFARLNDSRSISFEGKWFFFFFNCRIQSDSRRYYNTFVNNDYTIP